MVLRATKSYLPAFQPSKQVASDLVRARKSLIFPSSFQSGSTVTSGNIGAAFHFFNRAVQFSITPTIQASFALAINREIPVDPSISAVTVGIVAV
jgi:hypothetical protein